MQALRRSPLTVCRSPTPPTLGATIPTPRPHTPGPAHYTNGVGDIRRTSTGSQSPLMAAALGRRTPPGLIMRGGPRTPGSPGAGPDDYYTQGMGPMTPGVGSQTPVLSGVPGRFFSPQDGVNSQGTYIGRLHARVPVP